MRFLVFKRGEGYQWVLLRDHEGILATGPYPYVSVSDCMRAIAGVQASSPTTPIVGGDIQVSAGWPS
jgi:uncharacterized protein YegP (UPF0339 family)